MASDSDWRYRNMLLLGKTSSGDVKTVRVDSSGRIQTAGPLIYKGTWDASTNTPTLVSATGTQGDFYIVSVAGSTNLDGVTDWQVSDWAVFNGTAWQKADHSVIGTSESLCTVNLDGGGFAITTGIKGDIVVPYAFTLTGYDILADQSGSIVIDVWKDTYANFPPDNADSITASAPITISTASKARDDTLTGWTLSLAQYDILRFNVDSCTSIERVAIALKGARA